MRIDLLNRLDLPFVCGWYTLNITCSTPSSVHTAVLSLLTNCVLLWTRKYVGRAYVACQGSMKRLAAFVSVVFNVKMAQVSLK